MDHREEGRGIGDLLGDLGRQVSTLVRKEIDLARVEVTSSVGRMSRGAAMAGAGGAVLYAGLLVLLAAAVLGLIEAGVDAWLAAFIVGAFVLVVGGGRDLHRRQADADHRPGTKADGRDGSRERRVRQGADEVTTDRIADVRN